MIHRGAQIIWGRNSLLYGSLFLIIISIFIIGEHFYDRGPTIEIEFGIILGLTAILTLINITFVNIAATRIALVLYALLLLKVIYWGFMEYHSGQVLGIEKGISVIVSIVMIHNAFIAFSYHNLKKSIAQSP